MKRFLHLIIVFNFLLCGAAFGQSYKSSVSKSSDEALIAKNNKPENLFYSGEDFYVQNVYPNPAEDIITLKYSIPPHITNLKFEIRNILGNVVGTYMLTGNSDGISISTVNLDPGIYFHSLYLNNRNLVTRKLIIKR